MMALRLRQIVRPLIRGLSTSIHNGVKTYGQEILHCKILNSRHEVAFYVQSARSYGSQSLSLYDEKCQNAMKIIGLNVDVNLVREAFRDKLWTEILKNVNKEDVTKFKDNEQLAQEGEILMKEYTLQYLHKRVLFTGPHELLSEISDDLISDSSLSYVASKIGVEEAYNILFTPVPEETLGRTIKALTQAIFLSLGSEMANSFVRWCIKIEFEERTYVYSCVYAEYGYKSKLLTDLSPINFMLELAGLRGAYLNAFYELLSRNKKYTCPEYYPCKANAEPFSSLLALWEYWGIPLYKPRHLFRHEQPYMAHLVNNKYIV